MKNAKIKKLVLYTILAILGIVVLFNFNGYLTEKRSRELSELQRIEFIANEKYKMQKIHDTCEISTIDETNYFIFGFTLLSLFGVGLIKLMVGSRGASYIVVGVILTICVIGLHAYKKSRCENAYIYLQNN